MTSYCFVHVLVTGESVLPANAAALFQLLGVNGAVLTEALTHKKIIAKGEEVGLDTHSHCSVKRWYTRLSCLCNVWSDPV